MEEIPLKYKIEKAYTHNGHIYLEGWLVGQKANDHTEIMIYGKSGSFYPAHILRLERFDVRNFYFPLEAEGSYGFMARFTPSEEENYVMHLIGGGQLKKIPFTIRQIIETHSLPAAKNAELKSLFGFRKTTAPKQDFEKKYAHLPKFSILVSIHQKESAHLTDMFDSVLYQSYSNWELLLADCSESKEIYQSIPFDMERASGKIQYHKCTKQTTIAAAQNLILSRARGEFCVLLECNDVLEVHALERILQAINQNPKLDFIYSDYDLSDSFGESIDATMFKPSWSPEILYSAEYVSRVSVFRTFLLKAIGGWSEETQAVNYFELIERNSQIAHISEILYHWRQQAVERNVSTQLNESNLYQQTMQQHLQKMNLNATVEISPDDRQIFHIKWNEKAKRLTLVLADVDFKQDLAKSIDIWKDRLKQDGLNEGDYDVVVMTNKQLRTNHLSEDIKLHICKLEDYPKGLLTIAKESVYSHILFAYATVTPISNGLITELMGWTLNSNIGIAVPRILNSKRTILSEGLFLQSNAPVSFNRQFQRYGKSYFGNTMWYRNVSAALPDCFLIKRELLLECFSLNGIFWFQALCLWVQKEKQLRIVMTPFADVMDSYDWLESINTSQLESYHTFIRQNQLPDNDKYFNANWIRQQM